MPGLPLSLWTIENLTRIAMAIGEPLYIDETTLKMEKTMFARVCVKVDLSKKLTNSIKIQLPQKIITQNVLYEGFSIMCLKCGKVGHSTENCGIPLKKTSYAAAMGTNPTALPRRPLASIQEPPQSALLHSELQKPTRELPPATVLRPKQQNKDYSASASTSSAPSLEEGIIDDGPEWSIIGPRRRRTINQPPLQQNSATMPHMNHQIPYWRRKNSTQNANQNKRHQTDKGKRPIDDIIERKIAEYNSNKEKKLADGASFTGLNSTGPPAIVIND